MRRSTAVDDEDDEDDEDDAEDDEDDAEDDEDKPPCPWILFSLLMYRLPAPS